MMKQLMITAWLMTGFLLSHAQDIIPQEQVAMDDLMNIALQNRPELKIAALKVDWAKQALWKTKNQRLPFLQINADNRFNTQLQSNLLPGLIFGQPGQDRLVAFGATFAHVYGLEAGINLFKPEQKAEVRAKLASVDREEKNLTQIKQQIRFEITEAAFNHRIAYDQYLYAKAEKELAQSTFNEIEKALIEGKKQHSDKNRAKINLLQKENQLKEAYRQINMMKSKLHLALGETTYSKNYLLKEEALNGLPTPPQPDLGNNVDLQISGINLKQQEQQIWLQKSRILPQVTGYGLLATQYLSKDFDILSFSRPWTPFSYIGFRFNWVLFDKFDRSHSLKQEQIQFQVLTLEKEKLSQQLNQKQLELLEEYQSKLATSQLSMEQLNLTEEIYQTDLNNFKEGNISKVELETSKTKVLLEKINWNKSKAELWKTWSRLKQLQGNSVTPSNTR